MTYVLYLKEGTMFYILVALWILVCVVRCLSNPQGRQKFRDLMK